jgi:hypothetical protein
MSKRYSMNLYGPEGEDYGAVQATRGQTINLLQWMNGWADSGERRGRRRGLLYGYGLSTLVYGLVVAVTALV